MAKPVEEEKLSEQKLNLDEVTPDQIVSMTDEELDAYFSHLSTLVDKKSKNLA